jgi:D-amino-acid dehydrogenase
MAPDVVIVGGGAIGAACALELARAGASVTLLERGPELASGCSAGNAGLVCPSHSTPLSNPTALRNGLRWMLKPDSPFYLKPRAAAVPWLARFALAARHAERGAHLIREISVASLELHAAWGDELGTGFERRGVLNVYTTDETLAAARREAEGSGLPFQVLDRSEAMALEPSLAEHTVGGVVYPREGHCDPLTFVRTVGAAAVGAGATVRTDTEVRSLRRVDRRIVVSTRDEEIRPETVVLAAGAWSSRLARPAGLRIPLEGGKGYHVDLETGDDDPTRPVWLQESWVLATPLPGRLRLAGTLELAGLDLTIDRRRAEAVRAGGVQGVRGLSERRVVDVWAGLRPCTPDGLPVIGRPRQAAGLVIATGHAMKGLSLSPVTGCLVAELITGAAPSHDLGPFSPDRFGLLQ